MRASSAPQLLPGVRKRTVPNDNMQQLPPMSAPSNQSVTQASQSMTSTSSTSGFTISLSVPDLSGIKHLRSNSHTLGRKGRADPLKVWRSPHEASSLPLPSLAKGMSRHRCPVGTKPRVANVSKPATEIQNSAAVHAIIEAGREALGHAPWWKRVFEEVDGNDNGHLTPAEFSSLSARLQRELGQSPSGFTVNFNDADGSGDGHLDISEWEEYARSIEAEYSKPTCEMATWRFLGRRKAFPRKKRHHLYTNEGYKEDASLQLLTLCSKPSADNLYDLVERALEQGADPNAALVSRLFPGYTPLIFLALANSTVPGKPVADCIDLLIENNADVNLESESFGSLGKLLPIRVAAQLQNKSGLNALLQHLDVGERFQWAAGEHVEYVMLQELEKICDPQLLGKIQRKSRYSAQATILLIMFASPLDGNLTASGAKKLLEGEYEAANQPKGSIGKADPNGKGLDGTTALMEVAKRGDVETVKVLLQGKANPNQQDAEGGTPLHFAASFLHTEVVNALLQAEADPSIRDHAGFSAWMLVGESKISKNLSDTQKRQTDEFKDSMARDMLLKALQPQMSAEEIIERLSRDDEDTPGWSFFVADKPDEKTLDKRLRLSESLFFNPRAMVARAPNTTLLDKCAAVVMDFLRVDPLKGEQKKLTKALLLATMGPLFNKPCKHVEMPWATENNRATYESEFRAINKELLNGFAADCNQFRAEIELDAEAEPEGVCAALCALPADRVDVPAEWQDDGYWDDPKQADHWSVVQNRQLLRYDPEWAHGIHDGATMFLALLRLGTVADLAEYSELLQVHHRPMAGLLAEGYVRYSELCNEKFQDLMCSVARRAAEQHGCDVTFPDGYISTKKLKRLTEKLLEARKERGVEDWPGRERPYLTFSHCFYILDTVRLSFICNGETIQEQVSACLNLLDALKACTLEKDGMQALRVKSGFATGVKGSGGYADVKVLIFADLGTHKAFDGTDIPLRIIGEVQLILKSYSAVKGRMHLAYEVGRGSFDHLDQPFRPPGI